MNDNKDIDAFTHHILYSIDFKVLNSLTSEQLSAIKHAIKASSPQQKHSVDIRGIINLIFIKYYFVFFVGRDRRMSTEAIEEERRDKVALFGNIVFFVIVISAFIWIAIILLYVFKTISGIDLFPGEHLGRILGL